MLAERFAAEARELSATYPAGAQSQRDEEPETVTGTLAEIRARDEEKFWNGVFETSDPRHVADLEKIREQLAREREAKRVMAAATPEGRRDEIEELRFGFNWQERLASSMASAFPEARIAEMDLPSNVRRCAILLRREKVERFGDETIQETDDEATRTRKFARALAWRFTRDEIPTLGVPEAVQEEALRLISVDAEDEAILARLRDALGGRDGAGPKADPTDDGALEKSATTAIARRPNPIGWIEWLGRTFLSGRKSDASVLRTRVRMQLLNYRGEVIDELLTTEQASEMLGVSSQRISQLVNDGTFRKHDIGKRFYAIERKQVDEYAASNRRPGHKPTRF